MLIPDNIRPEESIYYNGAFVVKALGEIPEWDLIGLYEATKHVQDMSMPIFLLSLDWLFLLGFLFLNSEGRIQKCT
jgi:hypothetical protein